jgi:hypothetical protein
MAAYGLGLSLLQDTLTSQFTERELMNLHTWLNQITDPDAGQQLELLCHYGSAWV